MACASLRRVIATATTTAERRSDRWVRRLAGEHEPLKPKVPEILAMFWVIKLLTTGLGESASDFLGQTNVPMAGIIGIGGLYLSLRLQLRRREYHAPTYWFAVLMVAVFGTMLADGVRDGLSISYTVTSAVYAVILAAIFLVWHRSEGTLSIHSITTRRRECFYWAAVLTSFALGTALGDLTAIQLNIGFLPSAWVFLGMLLAPAIAWRLGLNGVVAFWCCYALTRPVGASFADWFGKPRPQSGLDLGDGPTSGVALLVFLVLVAFVAWRKRDIQPSGLADLPADGDYERADHALREPVSTHGPLQPVAASSARA